MLTVIILTYNESKHIADCLASLSWADHCLVFDSHSQDNTVEIAQKAGAEVKQARFVNYAQQRNAALEGIDPTDWVFFVDADERGTPELGREIAEVMNRTEAGWSVPRHNYIFGKLTLGAGWWPDYQLRLFRYGKVRYERPVHEVAVVDGEIGRLTSPLIHHNYRDVAHFHAKQAKYVAYDAEILRQQGVRPKWYTPYTLAIRHFGWRFITLDGYKIGWHGFHLTLLMAYYEWRKWSMVRRG